MRKQTVRSLMIVWMIPAGCIGFLVELWIVGYHIGKEHVEGCFDKFSYPVKEVK